MTHSRMFSNMNQNGCRLAVTANECHHNTYASSIFSLSYPYIIIISYYRNLILIGA